MSWVDELGEKKMSDKEAKFFADMFLLISSTQDDDKEFVNTLEEVIDTAIYNLTKIKEGVTKK